MKAIGVSRRDSRKGVQKWEAHLWMPGQPNPMRPGRAVATQYFVGSFATEEAARRARDLASLAFRPDCPTSHPRSAYAPFEDWIRDWQPEQFAQMLRRDYEGENSPADMCAKNFFFHYVI